MHPVVEQVTKRIIKRSQPTRRAYLAQMKAAEEQGVHRGTLSCGNLAHGFAACNTDDKAVLKMVNQVNVAMVSAYNDMLSAHQPFERYPDQIRDAIRELGSVAQFAGGVPAMCDGVTQGQPGMELSLFSRDLIAMATAVSLSHNMFDAALYLGVCDKIVPGLLMGALRFGHLPTVFVPAGPMPSGLPNKEKARIRQEYAQGKIGRDALLQCESDSYHSAGTCTFYGTANSNQMMVEIMGLHLPGSSFVNPGTELREQLTRYAAQQAVRLTAPNGRYTPLYEIVDEKSLVNGIVALLATGGSTNHTMHIIAIAAAAGVIIDWQDFSDLSDVVPLIARVYPNGEADINHFHAAGGVGYIVRELLGAGYLHDDVMTIMGHGLSRYTQEPFLQNGELVWREGTTSSLDDQVLRPAATPFSANGGLKLMRGNLGRGVIKVSAVAEAHRVVEAPAIVFNDQDDLAEAFKRGELEKDFIAVVRYQGPNAIGMPELHKLTPFLGTLQDKGFKVALVTDGRMSGASGKVPAAIHVWPEAQLGGPLAHVQDGDRIRLDATTGELLLLAEDDLWLQRPASEPAVVKQHGLGMGRELFGPMRSQVNEAERGATVFCFSSDTDQVPEHLQGNGSEAGRNSEVEA
ncbi:MULTISPECIES: phosphogluconate dehydratase [unclassified Oceanobacter]|uniref:phosphogluconate dehydratase n=2 Tax=Gammaproteobacteria TaxID=1236 RepID=UPI0027375485|nr:MULTISPECIES: phosphogluconate dehydratase [unclassified Oceanobacter]MDP2609911.1 phosphogluconate dehydratase [Oceanobacter sp. 1_MG-2023]MDP2613207.1 phosphogluconate dehydratase [Oceanobacter sp. 2_MG-2023]